MLNLSDRFLQKVKFVILIKFVNLILRYRMCRTAWILILNREPGCDPDPVKARLRSQYKLRGSLLEKESLKMQELEI
ncbi:hypothetical protein HanIR_Chr01g0002771 [Helianthus annuus]|nr:hypothetical protein HanIR_Chr01g0002771 [Helianthus annuus]